MKIALLHNLPSGGARRHTREQLRELAARGYEVVEFAPTIADLRLQSFVPYVRERRFYPCPPVRVFEKRVPLFTPYLHALQGVHTLRSMQTLNKRMAEEIDRDGFDLTLVKDCRVTMNPYGLRYLQTPSVFQCHHGLRHQIEDLDSNGRGARGLERLKRWYFGPARRWYARRFLADQLRNIQSASLVLTNSSFSRTLLAQHYGVDAHVVYPGIRAETFSPRGLPEADYVLCVGALIYSKGYRFLVRAISLIPAIRRPKLFVAANSLDPAEERVVRAMANDLAVRLHVEQITDDERLAEVYGQARAFVYAPMQEALGMAPLEAMACGTPVVAVAEGGVRETVLDGETGWLVDRHPQSFADRLSTLLLDDHGRARMGAAGVEYVRASWTWERAVDDLERRFQALLGAACLTPIRTPA